MRANLRPMRLGEILNRTFQIYQAKLFVLAGIATLPSLAWMVVSTTKKIFAMNIHGSEKYLLFHMTLLGLLSTTETYFVAKFISYLVYPAFIRVAVSVITGQPSSFLSSIEAIQVRIREFLALDLALLTAKVLAPAAIFIGSSIWVGRIVDTNAEGAIAVVAKLLFVLISGVMFGSVVWMSLSMSLSFPASAIERAAWLESIKRSWLLSRGGRVKIALTWLLIFSATIGIMMLVVLPTLVIVFALHWKGFAWHGYPLYKLLVSVEIAAISAMILPLYPIALTLFYYDQRIRHEGYDIEKMQLEGMVPAPPPAAGKTSAPVLEPSSKREFPQSTEPPSPERGEFI